MQEMRTLSVLRSSSPQKGVSQIVSQLEPTSCWTHNIDWRSINPRECHCCATSSKSPFLFAFSFRYAQILWHLGFISFRYWARHKSWAESMTLGTFLQPYHSPGDQFAITGAPRWVACIWYVFDLLTEEQFAWNIYRVERPPLPALLSFVAILDSMQCEHGKCKPFTKVGGSDSKEAFQFVVSNNNWIVTLRWYYSARYVIVRHLWIWISGTQGKPWIYIQVGNHHTWWPSGTRSLSHGNENTVRQMVI